MQESTSEDRRSYVPWFRYPCSNRNLAGFGARQCHKAGSGGATVAPGALVHLMTLFSACLLACCVLSLGTGCEKGERLVIAEVDGRSITLEDYRRRVAATNNGRENGLAEGGDTLRTTGAAAMRSLLDSIIVREVVISEALRQKLDESEAVTVGLGQFEAALLREALCAHEVDSRVGASEAELKAYFTEQGYDREIRISQIVRATRSGADSVLRILRAGANFAVIARDLSVHRPSGRQGGDLGFVREKAVIPELKPILSVPTGSVCPRALRSPMGYHIVKVTDRRRQDFDSQRDRITSIVTNLKRKKLTNAYLQSIEKSWRLSPSTAGLRMLYARSASATQGIPSLGTAEANSSLFTWNEGTLTCGEYLGQLRSLEPSSRPVAADTAAIYRFARDVAIDRIVVAEARSLSYDRDPDVRRKVAARREELLAEELFRLEGKDRDRKAVISGLMAKYAPRIVVYEDRLARITL